MTFGQKENIKAIIILAIGLALIVYGVRGMMEHKIPELIAEKISNTKTVK